MNLTKEQLLQNAAAMRAFAEGKQIQYKNAVFTDWTDLTASPYWNFEHNEYRPKPEPKTRPWRQPSDVPGPVCWVRNLSVSIIESCLVVAIDETGVWLLSTSYGCAVRHGFGSAMASCEYSTDRVTWHKCEVAE